MSKSNATRYRNNLQDRKINFLKKANQVHGNRYNYSLSNYINNSEKIDIICRVHGVFRQQPNNHLSGNGCPICAQISRERKYRFRTVDVINRFRSVHGDYYDYSKVVYKNGDTPVEIICPNHGLFKQTPYHHNKIGAGCPICTKVSPYSRTRYVDSCNNRGDGTSNLYVLLMHGNGEDFYKIGITNKTVQSRYSNKIKYSYDVLYFINGEASFIWDMESAMHKLLSKYHYKPTFKFGGSATECFSTINPISKLLIKMSKTDQLHLLA